MINKFTTLTSLAMIAGCLFRISQAPENVSEIMLQLLMIMYMISFTMCESAIYHNHKRVTQEIFYAICICMDTVSFSAYIALSFVYTILPHIITTAMLLICVGYAMYCFWVVPFQKVRYIRPAKLFPTIDGTMQICVICCEKTGGTDKNPKGEILPCGHIFHNSCILQNPKTECPLCRHSYEIV